MSFADRGREPGAVAPRYAGVLGEEPGTGPETGFPVHVTYGGRTPRENPASEAGREAAEQRCSLGVARPLPDPAQCAGA